MASFATSYIPTTTAAVTRSADVASISGSNFSSWYRQDEGTIYGVSVPRNSTSLDTAGTAIGVASFSDGTNNERIRYGVLGTSTIWIDNNVSQAGLGSGSFAKDQQLVLASAYRVDDFTLVRSGGAIQSDTSGTLPSITQVELGRSAVGAGLWTGTLSRLTYWPTRLGNEVLQRLTQ
jgi:hypothetical protein